MTLAVDVMTRAAADETNGMISPKSRASLTRRITLFRKPLKRPSNCTGETSAKFHGPTVALIGSRIVSFPIPGLPPSTSAWLITEHHKTSREFAEWLGDRRNSRQIPHRMESAGYVPVRNPARKDGLWLVRKRRTVIYSRRELSVRDRIRESTESTKERVARRMLRAREGDVEHGVLIDLRDAAVRLDLARDH